MKIALIQTQIAWEDKEKNIRSAQNAILNAADHGARLALFPEMSFTGFSMNTDKTAEKKRETAERMLELAKRYGIAIGFGWVRDAGKKCENCYSIVDKDGSVLSEYVKIHPFSYSGEDQKFVGGKNIVTFELDGVSFSTFICYDLRFPEAFRMAAKDVSAFLVPANWPAKRAEHWKTLLRARAVENQAYVFSINCYGTSGGQYYSGDSCVINPNGDVLECLSDQEGMIFFDFCDDVREYRKSFPTLRDRVFLIEGEARTEKENPIINEIRECLFRFQDEKYKDFQGKLIPTVEMDAVIGVRTPKLRELAKQFGKREDIHLFLDCLPHKYFDENQLHAFLISQGKEFQSCVDAVCRFLPYVDNWATCDQMSPKIFKKHRQLLLPYIKDWLSSDRTYTVRFAIGMLMQHFLDEDFTPAYLEMVAGVDSQEYYIRMMAAWYFATALAKQYDAALPFLEQKRLDVWTHNKTIQKSVESRRILPEQKAYLRSLKV